MSEVGFGLVEIVEKAYEDKKMDAAMWMFRASQDKQLTNRWREHFLVGSWFALLERESYKDMR